MVANPVWGHLADTKIGRLTSLQIGLVGSAAAAFLLNTAAALPAITALMIVQSVFMVAQLPNVDAIALEHLGDERMSDYGRLRAWTSLSYATGCFLFGVILERRGVGWAMPIYGLCAIVVLVWSATIERDRPHTLEDHGRLGSLGAVFRAAPRYWGFLAAGLLVWTGSTPRGSTSVLGSRIRAAARS
jgi:MFS family permease